MMKKLYDYSSPNSLSLVSGDVARLYQNKEIGIMQVWASRASVIDDENYLKSLANPHL